MKKPKAELDLHGIKHQDVEHTLENFFLWENKTQKQLISVVVGRSPQMQIPKLLEIQIH